MPPTPNAKPPLSTGPAAPHPMATTPELTHPRPAQTRFLRSLRQQAARVLSATAVDDKLSQAAQLKALLDGQPEQRGAEAHEPTPAALAVRVGRPARPLLIHAADVPARGVGSLEGRAALVHAVAHIEFNAINLACDAVWRFDGMPEAYYREWAQVAFEESVHFAWLRDHLRGMQPGPRAWDYGSFDAHDGLWSLCERTSDDVLARMALVPRLLEARGLDATPHIQAKLRGVQSDDARRLLPLLDRILHDEIGHVAVGNRWYHWLCDQRGLNPLDADRQLAAAYLAPRLHGPFNLLARAQAGFTASELDALTLE